MIAIAVGASCLVYRANMVRRVVEISFVILDFDVIFGWNVNESTSVVFQYHKLLELIRDFDKWIFSMDSSLEDDVSCLHVLFLIFLPKEKIDCAKMHFVNNNRMISGHSKVETKLNNNTKRKWNIVRSSIRFSFVFFSFVFFAVDFMWLCYDARRQEDRDSLKKLSKTIQSHLCFSM